MNKKNFVALGSILNTWLSGAINGCFSSCLIFIITLFTGTVAGIILCTMVLDPKHLYLVNGIMFGASFGLIIAIIIGIINIVVMRFLLAPFADVILASNFHLKYRKHVFDLFDSATGDSSTPNTSSDVYNEEEAKSISKFLKRVGLTARATGAILGIIVSSYLVFSISKYVDSSIGWKIATGILFGISTAPLWSNIGLILLVIVIFFIALINRRKIREIMETDT